MNPDLSSLEWQSLLRHYSAHCLSAPAKEAALEVLPAESVEEARSALALTAEGLEALENGTYVGLSSLEVLDPVLERLLRSAVLDGKDLLLLARAAAITQELRNTLSSPGVKGDRKSVV